MLGAALSILGVLLVLSRGEWAVLRQFRLVPGDFYVLAACIGWAIYSWMLSHPTPESASLRADWKVFLLSQVVFGLGWSVIFTSAEWAWTAAHVDWGWPLAAALAYVALGPSIVAYGAYGAAIQRAGPHMAAHCINLTPLFTALLSAVFLGEAPRLFHAVAFVLMLLGIALSREPARRAQVAPKAAQK
jgi:drug/metabolite transporter (DMT)-like permease